MSTTAMHFGPEWMRPKTQTSRSSTRESSPPPATSPAPPGASTYSALLTPSMPAPPERPDGANPFKYSRDELLRIYQEGGGKGSLGLEVERWEGVVREVSSDPIALKDFSEADKKLFAGSLNSELRRRQSTDFLSIGTPTGDRPKLYHSNSGAISPMRDRFGSMLRRKDSTEQPTLSIPRKLSVSSTNGPLHSPRDAALPSPRIRGGVSPGFDGILSSGDSWMARRRTSDATRPGGLSATRGPDNGGDGRKGSEIKEEEEEEGKGLSSRALGASQDTGGGAAHAANGQNHGGSAAFESLQNAADHQGGIGLAQEPGGTPIGQGADSSVNTAPNKTRGDVGVAARSAPAPTAADLASVEWSYIDPQGNIQGPFRADVMQNWHDAGFFTPDLRMKRTHLDNDWISVGGMLARADTNRIFLIPALPPAAPPGLGRRPDGIPESPAQTSFQSPLQSVPSHNLRNTALDPYPSGPSSTASNSPASSFSAGRFGNASPDPHAFGGRAGLYSNNDPIVGSRLQTGFSAAPEPTRRATFGEPLFGQYGGMQSSYGGTMGAMQSPLGGFSMNAGIEPIHRGSLDSNPNFVGGFSPGFNLPGPGSQYGGPISPAINQAPAVGRPRSGSIGLGGVEYRPGEDQHNHTSQNRPMFGTVPVGGQFGTNGSHIREAVPMEKLSPAVRHASPAQVISPPISMAESISQNQAPSVSPAPSQREAAPLISLSIPAQVSTPPVSSVHPTWGNSEAPGAPRPTPFSAPHPKVSNTIPANATPQAPGQFTSRAQNISGPKSAISTNQSPWGLGRQPSQSASAVSQRDASPWVAASQGVVQEGWGESHAGSSNLTFSNLVQHNQQQDTASSSAVHDSPTGIETIPLPAQAEPASATAKTQAAAATAPTPAAETPTPAVPKAQTKRKSSNKAAVADATATPAPPVPAPAPDVLALAAKAPWSQDEEAKKQPSGVALGFREIQEAEAKRAEARKVAEKDRAARAAAQASPVDEAPAFTTSWGLPTSKTGARGTPALATKETPTPAVASSPATPPVWTNSAKAPPAKKGMKEIQEEEERRKKSIKEKESVAAAARRGYADTTTKVAPAPAPVVAGAAWTTVGTTGKSATPAAAPARPPMASVISSSSAASIPARANGSAVTPRPPAAIVQKPAPSAAAKDDFPMPPSQDFMKWLGDSLKGLNSSVNYEDITSMLLTFPIDPDPSTTELIAEMIYASSTTLDGRRFATEFVSKRKADAATRSKVPTSGGTAAKSGAPASIADVVKAQPKPAQNEWGGFKIVNKKKKSGRA